MRADRLVAVLLLMQARGRITAAEVATELEISVATARRDLEALSAAGIPVYPQPGRGGGWSLVGGARTDLTGLTAAEAQALFLLTGPAAATAGPDSGAVATALRKLMRALPAPFRSGAQAAAAATLVDPAGWGERHRERPESVARLQDAVVRQHEIRFAYQGEVRTADPWGVVDKDDVWYLVAGTGKGQRTFRVDRMSDLTVTGGTFERPADFSLTAAWEQVTGELEKRRSRTWATVVIQERFVWVLRDHFGRHCHVETDSRPDEGQQGHGHERVRVRVGAPTARDIARTLSGWGAQVEVLDPPAVRAELARIGAELAALYSAERGDHSPAT